MKHLVRIELEDNGLLEEHTEHCFTIGVFSFNVHPIEDSKAIQDGELLLKGK